MKKVMSICLMMAMLVVFTACNDNSGNNTTGNEVQKNEAQGNTTGSNEVQGNVTDPDEITDIRSNLKPVDRYQEIEQNPVVTMTMENGGVVKMELYPKVAPESVENMISLIKSGFYNGLTFHRTIPGFMAQGGDPEGNGMGGPGYAIYGEFSDNHDFKNDISHKRGVLSMARSGNMFFPEAAYNTAGSQFFIVTTDSTFLDGQYAAFGEVIEGMDVVDEIVNSEVVTRDESNDEANRPVTPPVIKEMTVDTFGVEYGEPYKIIN